MNSLPSRRSLVSWPEVHFAGLRFHALSLDEAVSAVAARPAGLPFDILITPNAEHAWLRSKDDEFNCISATAWLSTNDSRVLKQAARFGGVDLGFAPGAHIVDVLFQRIIASDEAITIIGGDESMIADLARQFRLTKIAHHNPPMGFINKPEAVAAAIDFVVTHPARFVFVAMGPPQSEKFCQRLINDGRAMGLGLCIGSSISTIIGRTPPAPQWMEDRGLVWLYRLVREPERLWKRYLLRGFYGLGRGLLDAIAFRLRLKTPDSPIQ
nr:WecB/TagA/CpsF family glycosyltransferase [uncultured Brevundimonas sp.]